MWAPLGNSVHQFPGVVTLAYYLRLKEMIHHQKYLFKEYIHKWKISSPEHTHICSTIRCRKTSSRASKQLWKFRTRKLPEVVNCATIKETGKLKETMVGVQVEQVAGHQYPPGSFLHPLGSNGPHCIEFLHEMRKLMLNLVFGQPLSLVKELAYFDKSIQLDLLLAGVIDLCP